MPLVLVDSVVELPAGKYKGSYSYHVVRGQVHKGLAVFVADIVEVCLNDLPPFANDRFVISHQDVVAVEFHHFLETHDDQVSLVDRKVEQLIKLTWCDLMRIDHVTVPRQCV